MNDTASSSGKDRLTPVGRVTDSVLNRQPGHFVAELILIAAGVLIALAIDGWVSDAHDRKTEVVYLELLARDIREIGQLAEDHIDFERAKIDTGVEAYNLLFAPDPAAHNVELRQLLGLLSSRHTLVLNSATYDQLVSSGDLQLIREAELRDKLVRYFDQMERNERIAEKNNRDLIDYVYVPFLMRAGISVTIRSDEPAATLNRANEILSESLGAELVYAEDLVLLATPEANSWNDIRRNVLWRTRISAVGMSLAETIVSESDEIAAAVAAELGGG